MDKGKKLVLWIGVSLIGTCCCGITIPLWTMLNGGNSVDKALDTYRTKGLPWTSAEVDLRPPAKPGEDAAPLLNQAFTFLRKSGSTDSSRVLDLLLANDNLGAQAVIDKYAAPLKLAHQAAQLPRAEYRKDWDMGPEVTFPELADAKTIIKLLSSRAILEARRGDVAASDIDLLDAWNIGKLMGSQPTLIAMLVQIAGRAIVMAAVEQSITEYVLQPEALRQLNTTLDKFGDDPEFVPTIRGEAYMGLTILRNAALFKGRMSANGSDSSEPAPPPLDKRLLIRTGSPSGFVERLIGGKLIQAYVRINDIARKDAGNWNQLDADLKAMDQEYSADEGPTAYYRTLLMPVYANAGEALVKDQARRITVKALLLGVLKHAQGGKYPKSIKEIPGTWLDPFNGEQLRVAVLKDSFRVYSVGPNRKSDGGKAQIESGGSADYDIVAASPPIRRPGKTTPRSPSPKRR